MVQINKFLFLFFLMPAWLSAQLGIILEDETKTGFKLVIDGYLQNEQSLNKINLLKLPAGEHELLFLMNDGLDLRRIIDFNKADNYHFVILKNFAGERKLRYRGSYTEINQSALALDFNKTIDYQDQAKIIATVDSLPHYKTRPEAEALKTSAEMKIILDSAKIISAIPLPKTPKDSVIIKVMPNTLPIDLDSNSLATAEQSITNITDPFGTLQSSIKLNSFEFDKIHMIEEFMVAEKMSASQLETLLKQLKYDQSRLQILEYALNKQADLKEAKESLLITLEYELSQQKAKTFFQ
ncbi:MAG: hypothetical protein ACJAZH_001353 [Roseivirga sp.]|jgi:hypothetical protein